MTLSWEHRIVQVVSISIAFTGAGEKIHDMIAATHCMLSKQYSRLVRVEIWKLTIGKLITIMTVASKLALHQGSGSRTERYTQRS